MSLLTEVEAVVSDVRDVYDLVVTAAPLQGGVEQLDKRLNHHCEVFLLVVSSTVDLNTKNYNKKTTIRKEDVS